MSFFHLMHTRVRESECRFCHVIKKPRIPGDPSVG